MTKESTPTSKPTGTKKGSTPTSKPTGTGKVGTQTSKSQDDDMVVLNIGGTRFETRMRTLRRWPETRLAKTTRKDADNYREQFDEYFYDRDPEMFRCIIDFYRNGILHFPHDICGPVIHYELSYWEIDEQYVSQCCWEFFKSQSENQTTVEVLCKSLEPEVDSRPRSGRRRVTSAGMWSFLEDPASSNCAMVRLGLWVNATYRRGFCRGGGCGENTNNRNTNIYLTPKMCTLCTL